MDDLPLGTAAARGQAHVAHAIGRSQAVRLPAAFRFDTKEVFIRQDPKTGDVILSRKPTAWDGFFKALQATDLPQDSLNTAVRAQGRHEWTPLEGWHGCRK